MGAEATLQHEFLVEIHIDLPADMTDRQRADLQAREQATGRELMDAGTILRIWRVPGRTANVGIWTAPDVTSLHASIACLPMFRWMTATVHPLAAHPLETGSQLR